MPTVLGVARCRRYVAYRPVSGERGGHSISALATPAVLSMAPNRWGHGRRWRVGGPGAFQSGRVTCGTGIGQKASEHV